MLPLEFIDGDSRQTYAIDGSECFDVVGEVNPGAELELHMTRRDGDSITTRALPPDRREVSIYNAGGVLQRFAEDLQVTKQPLNKDFAEMDTLDNFRHSWL